MYCNAVEWSIICCLVESKGARLFSMATLHDLIGWTKVHSKVYRLLQDGLDKGYFAKLDKGRWCYITKGGYSVFYLKINSDYEEEAKAIFAAALKYVKESPYGETVRFEVTDI
jgi:hypothetical protein